MAKRYYWLKLKEDFYDDDTMQYIEEQENGIYYSNFYMKLCLKALKSEGKLIRLIGDTLIPYDTKSLSKLTGVPVDTVRVAMNLFEHIGLVKILDTGELYLTQMEEMIGSETDKAQIMRRKRAEEKRLGNNVTTALPECYTEKEIEKEKELEKDIDSCAEVNSTPEIFINLPLNTGENWPVTLEYIEELKPLYPAVDVEQEIRKMRGWLDSNVRNRKTSRGIKKFITGWLAREQDKGRVVNRGHGPYQYYQQPQKQSVDQFKADMQRLAEEQNGEW